MKVYIIILLLLLFIPIGSAELTIEPEIVDTYFLYSGMGENQTSKYKFNSNYDVISCEMIPQNDSVSCHIEDGYIIEVWFTTYGEPYIGELQVTNNNETTASSTVIIRTHDFGSYSEIAEIPVGNLANSTRFNYFFSTENENVTGIRNWLIWYIGILFGFAVILSMRR